MSSWFWYAVAAAVLYGAHQIFTRLASERIGDGLGVGPELETGFEGAGVAPSVEPPAVAEVGRIVDENGQRKHGVDQVRIGAIIRGLTEEVDRIQGKEPE